MNELILHQYAGSPFSEKIRAILGLKKLAWRAVEIPNILPKPDLVAMTGGYRRTPVLQIGAHVYCDTELIARRIDELAPAPPLYPPALAAAAIAAARWADAELFQAAAVLFSQRQVLEQVFADEKARAAFVADRVAMRKGAPGRRLPRTEARALFEGFVRELDTQLAQGGVWLLGGDPSIADFSVYHALWFVRISPHIESLLAPYAHVARWMQGVRALGHGTPAPLTSTEAVALARKAAPEPIEAVSDSADLPPGSAVEVRPTDYALDPVAGELVRLSADSIAVRRTDARAGQVVVHFPRRNYEVRARA